MGAISQAANRAGQRCREHSVMLHRPFDVARQIFHPQITDRNPKIVSGYILEFMRFIEDDGPSLGKNSCVRCPVGLQFDREVREK